MSDRTSQGRWLGELEAVMERLTDRLALLQRGVGGVDAPLPEVAAGAIEELAVAVEELHASHAESRVQAEELASAQGALETARREYQALFDFAPDAYVVTDERGIIRRANHALSALIGHARKYAQDKPLASLLHPDSVQPFSTRLADLRDTADDRVREWEVRFRGHRNSGPRDVAIRVAPVRDPDGRLTGFRWLLRDITAQKQLAAQLQRQEAAHTRELRQRTAELEAIARMQETSLRLAETGEARATAALEDQRAVVRGIAEELVRRLGSEGVSGDRVTQLARTLLDMMSDDHPPPLVRPGRDG
jgi:PAS domain S-box-containing protein